MLLLLAAPATSAAADVDDDRSPDRPVYGLAMAGAYVAAPLLGITSAVALGPRVGFTVFALTPPIVHLAYADPWWALASLFGPTVSAATTSLLMIPISQCNLFGNLLGKGGGNCDGPMLFGAVTGYLAWAVVDVNRKQPAQLEIAPLARQFQENAGTRA